MRPSRAPVGLHNAYSVLIPRPRKPNRHGWRETIVCALQTSVKNGLTHIGLHIRAYSLHCVVCQKAQWWRGLLSISGGVL